MGLKALISEFKIKHIVQRECRYKADEKYIAIGSEYVHDLITIDKNYNVKWGNLGPGNKDLNRNFDELTKASESGFLKEVIEKEDICENLIPVWSYDRGKVFKKYCEKFGWPEITTEGYIMFENTYFLTRKEALKACRIDAKIFFNRFGIGESFWRFIESSKRLFGMAITNSWHTFRAYVFFGI